MYQSTVVILSASEGGRRISALSPSNRSSARASRSAPTFLTV